MQATPEETAALFALRDRFRAAIDSGAAIAIHALPHGAEPWVCIHVGGPELCHLPREDFLEAIYGADVHLGTGPETVH